MSNGIVIVGGGLAAVRLTEQLREASYDGPLTIVGDEAHLPYDRPPLSKAVLRREADDTTLRPRAFYDELRVTLRLGAAAAELDTAAQHVTLRGGERLGYDDLVIATGLLPRRVPSLPDLDCVHVLRTLDDALAVRAAAIPGARAVIVGAGFVGCEVAASLRGRGVEVVLVEPQPEPLASVLGREVGALVARMHRGEGVDVRTGVGVTGVAADAAGYAASVTLSDGTDLPADLVVVGVGSRPATDWLGASGVTVEDGVRCDHLGRTDAPHVWALGDVAAWPDATGRHVRAEHWSNVADQARVLVPALLGRDSPPEAVVVPYFWSDQYDVKIQCLGAPAADDVVHLVTDDGRRFLAYYERDGVVAGVVGGGVPGKVMKTRTKIANAAPICAVLG